MVRIPPAKIPHGLNRPALPPQPPLDIFNPDLFPQISKGQATELETQGEGGHFFFKRVAKGGQDPDLIDRGSPGQTANDRAMACVGGIKRSPKEGDVHNSLIIHLPLLWLEDYIQRNPCPASLRASGASAHQVADLVTAGLWEEETIVGFSFGERHAPPCRPQKEPLSKICPRQK